MDTKYFILIEHELKEVDQEKYDKWYHEKGRFLSCRSIDLGLSDNIFGGYNGVKNGDAVEWKPFSLTYSAIDIDSIVHSKTLYFDTYLEMCETYEFHITLDMSEWSFPQVPGPFTPDIHIDEVNENLMFGD